eukprot:scaffold5682_cov140-Cylindrotheca_fusiformis.AAC.14
MAGQYFDRPPIQAVAKQLGTHHTEDGRNNVATLSSFFLPSFLYTWQMFKAAVIFPLLSAKEAIFQTIRNPNCSSNGISRRKGGSKHANSSKGSKRGKDSLSEANLRINTLYSYWSKFWSRHGPPLQMTIPLFTFLYYLYVILLADISEKSEGTHALTMNMRTQSNNIFEDSEPMDDILPYGGFQRLGKPSWKQLMFLLSISGTLMTIIIFGRVILPVSDLVAGGHCPEGASLFELNKVFFPAGIDAVLRPDGNYQSQLTLITADRGATFFTILSVIVITGSAILTQAATLQRSYLAIMGHLAGGWTIVSESHPAVVGRPKPSSWDPRRRYNKGDLISQAFPGIGTQTIYMATTNQPEGKPYDLGLRAAHDMFRNELGHPGNSALIKFLVTMHLNLIVAVVMMLLAYHALDYDCGSLRWTLVANLLAAYGTISVTTNDWREMDILAGEISGSIRC